jgi:HK97 family phage major capsid protein
VAEKTRKIVEFRVINSRSRIHHSEAIMSTAIALNRSRMLSLKGLSPADPDDPWELLPHQADALAHGGRNRYSLRRAIKFAYRGWGDGLEAEVHQEIRLRNMGRATGFHIPHDAVIESYALDTGAGAGSIRTSLAPTILDVLRSKLVMQRMGCQIGDFRSDRSGSVQIPRASAASTTTWLPEGGSVGSGSPTIGQITAAPAFVATQVDVTRMAGEEGSPAFAQFVVDHMSSGIAHAIDAAAIGNLAAPAPPGLLSKGWLSVPLTADAITLAALCDIERKIGDANAEANDDAKMGWLTSPAGRQCLRGLDVGSGSGRFAWMRDPEAGDTVMGYTAVATGAVPSNMTDGSVTTATPLIHGNFSHVYINLFSSLSVIRDDYTQAGSGTVRLTAFQNAGVLFAYVGSSFCVVNIACPAT